MSITLPSTQVTSTPSGYLATFKRLGALEHALATEFQAEYGRILFEAKAINERARLVVYNHKEYIEYIEGQTDGFYAPLCHALFFNEDFDDIAWEMVQENLVDILNQFFPYEEDEDDDPSDPGDGERSNLIPFHEVAADLGVYPFPWLQREAA
jgi:hypothetical protein